ncbi:hypothetical protein [Ideonella azotifigens]|uniref:hypothetical protein n=1 Tax=Ideonella azotifigens TaxID=513160 RepID=UPI001141F7E8|nr:hypothetical protein [Ideonella azotifigens]
MIVLAALASYAYRSAAHDRDVEAEAKAEEWQSYERARTLETTGSVQGAYRLYDDLCQDGSFVHNNLPRREQPCIKATELADEISVSYEATMAALERYRAIHGVYPDDLSPVKDDIPLSATRAFAGMKLHTISDGGIGVETGMYSAETFRLEK